MRKVFCLADVERFLRDFKLKLKIRFIEPYGFIVAANDGNDFIAGAMAPTLEAAVNRTVEKVEKVRRGELKPSQTGQFQICTGDPKLPKGALCPGCKEYPADRPHFLVV